MSIEEKNKAAARRWTEEGFSKQNIELIDECLHPDYTQRSGTEGPWSITVQGLEAAKAGFAQYFRDYPTGRVTIEDIIAEGDKVVTRVTGYNEGKPIANGIVIFRMDDGKIIDDWYSFTVFENAETT